MLAPRPFPDSTITYGQGGGITNILGGTFDATVTVDHSTISGNITTGSHGAQ